MIRFACTALRFSRQPRKVRIAPLRTDRLAHARFPCGLAQNVHPYTSSAFVPPVPLLHPDFLPIPPLIVVFSLLKTSREKSMGRKYIFLKVIF